ncbi:MAG: hypothetical protein KBA82_07970 [Nitrosomonas sp.]|nr:hypothetical protein [Nitrosomonas sp.]
MEFGVDLSGSMAGQRQKTAGDFSVLLLDKLGGTGFLNSGGSFYFTDCVTGDNPISTNIPLLRDDLKLISSASTALNCYGGGDTRVYDAIIYGSDLIYRQLPSLTRLYVVLTDGEHGGTITTPADVAKNLSAGVITELILIANSGAPGYDGLQKIASLAGEHVRVRATTDLNSIVDDIVNRTCTNFRPTASFTFTDNELHLGIEGFTIKFDGSSSFDPDGSLVQFKWHFTRPDGSTFDEVGIQPTITFDDKQLPRDSWNVRLTVQDNLGVQHDTNRTFRVIGSPPKITINGPLQIDALQQSIELSASTTTDLDGGPPLVLRWDIIDAPLGASLGKQNDYQGGPNGGPASISIPTTDLDIGKWLFRLTARDNEGEEGSSEVEVTVRNLPPKITLDPAGNFEIDAGQTISVTNTTPDDPDGGTVMHDWELIQVPVTAGVWPQRRFPIGSTLSPTLTVPNAQAGTWIFKLHVIDNDNAADSEVTQEVIVVVDGPATAEIIGPENIMALTSLTLDASGSQDTDSLPLTSTDPERGHRTSESAVRGITPGINSYQWSLVEVPSEHFPRYMRGPIEYSFNVPNGINELFIRPGLPMGSWTFQLEVSDAEFNRDVTTHTVRVLEPNTPPIAIADSTKYTLTDASGIALQPVAASAALSFDLDNLITPPHTHGCSILGICNFHWQYLLAPSGCPSPPVPISGVGAETFQLYAAGTAIPTLCHGNYLLGVTVTDDDMPALTNFAQIPLSIGNCNGEICIDYPTSTNYKYVEFADHTDVTIFYHLNSALYANPLFANGVKLEMALFHDSDPNLTTPIYTGQMDFDVLSAVNMGYAAAHWHGFTNNGTRPRPGKYTVRIRATQPLLPAPYSEAIQTDAIWLEVLDVAITGGSDRLLSLNRLATGADSLRIDYTVSAHFSMGYAFDEAWLHIRSTANPGSIIGSVPIPSPTTGTFNWTGELSPGVQVDPGEYTVEVEIKKAGRSLGISPRNAFIAYRIDMQVDGTLSNEKQTPGAKIAINGTPKNLTVKLEPSSLSGSVRLQTSGNVGKAEIKDGAMVLNTDPLGGITQPASDYSVPKVLTVKMLRNTVNPTKFEIIYTPPSGSPPGKDAADFVNLNGLDVVGLKPFCSDELTNANTGVFVQRNPTTVGIDFEQLKFIMHPITVTVESLTGGISPTTEVILEYEQGSAAIATLYEAGGAHATVVLPKTWNRSDFDPNTKKLEVKLIANGVDYGDVVLRLTYKADGIVISEKKLKLRVNDSPGITGRASPSYPDFLYQRVFSDRSDIAAALDTSRYADRINRKAKVYVVPHKTPAEWAIDNRITPVAMVVSPELTFTGASVKPNISALGIVPASEKGYDIIYDFGSCPSDPSTFTTDLHLDPGDVIDSIAPDQPSLVVLPNALANGPYAAVSAEYGTGAAPKTTHVPSSYDGLSPPGFDFRLRGKLVYPDRLPVGTVPLVVIAHGNHLPTSIPGMPPAVPINITSDENYRGYTYLQEHLASHGYITLSVDLDQMLGGGGMLPSIAPSGILLRANVMLRNIEEVLTNATIAGGALNGKIDKSKIYLLGHSRGGEAVLAAWKLYTGGLASPAGPYVSGLSIRGIVSVAPVSTHAIELPSSIPFLMVYGSADGDVNGASIGVQPFVHYDRAHGAAHLVYAIGANHNFFNSSWAYSDAADNLDCRMWPCLLTPLAAADRVGMDLQIRSEQEKLLKGYVLAFLNYYDRDQVAYSAYFNNPPSLLRPAGIALPMPLTLSTKRPLGAPRKMVLDDYETEPTEIKASSGADVGFTVVNLTERVLADPDLIVLPVKEPEDRFFQATRGGLFEWSTPSHYTIKPVAPIDFRNAALAFRVAQQPLHPQTLALNGPLDFAITLSDGVNASTVGFGAWTSVREIYPSKIVSQGIVSTKAVFETRIIPWWAFVANGSVLDLSRIAEIRLDLGVAGVSPKGRIAIDDVEIWR